MTPKGNGVGLGEVEIDCSGVNGVVCCEKGEGQKYDKNCEEKQWRRCSYSCCCHREVSPNLLFGAGGAPLKMPGHRPRCRLGVYMMSNLTF